MSPPVELVVTDLDGTLWPYANQGLPHPATLAAWGELERRGTPVLVATGRRVTSTRDPLAALGLAPSAVVLNGALAVDLASGAFFHRHRYGVDDAEVVLAAFRSHDLEPCVYVEHADIDVYISQRPSTSAEHLAALGSRAREADLDEIVASTSVLSFGVFGIDADHLSAVATELDDRAEPRIVADVWGAGHGMTVTPFGLSKWTGVLAFCERRGIDATRVLAIGDETNDIELIANAAVGLAVADAHPEALGVADHVVPTASEGGWAQLLDYL